MRKTSIAGWVIVLVGLVGAGEAAGPSRTGGAADRGALQPTWTQALLEAHNAVRAHVDVPPLRWSEPLARYAQEWAETLLRENVFHHRPVSPYGENLFMVEGGSCAPEEVVRAWAAESRNYDPAAGRCRAECGHFTQIVWRATRSVGCAVARGRGREIWVCNYDPPGNVAGERPY